MEWRPRPSDVIVLTFPKSGTTLVQQICEQLRSGGSMEFEEITQVQPWVEIAPDAGQDLCADHAHEPRIFKSHQRLAAAPRGCKMVIVVRDPAAVLESYWAFDLAHGKRQFAGWDSPSALALARDSPWYRLGLWGNDPWDFVADAWAVRQLPEVLLLSYELICEDLPAHVATICAFLGLEPSAQRLELACAHSSRAFMAEHVGRFDDSWLFEQLAARGGRVPPPAAKVHAAPRTSKLSAEARAALEREWSERVSPRTGLGSYGALVEALRAQRRQA